MIDWDKAPDWAVWAAQDQDGQWYYYAKKPIWRLEYWMPNGAMHMQANQDEVVSEKISQKSLKLNPKVLKKYMKYLLSVRQKC